jgi:glutathione S-transferase
LKLFTCRQEEAMPAVHPCGKAAKALRDSGYEFEIEPVGGYRLMPWTWSERSRARSEVIRLSGQRNVPVLVLDDGEVIAGSGEIVRWARENPAVVPDRR